MKTEPIEALEEIKHCTWIAGDFNISDGFESYEVVDEDDAINIVNMAFREGQSNPKIKQLEWEDNFKETRWYCDLPIGFYIIDTVYKYEPYRVRFYLSEYDYPKYERFCKTIDEAKAAAQAEFEKRVMECLDL